jgi:hypothetical protein
MRQRELLVVLSIILITLIIYIITTETVSTIITKSFNGLSEGLSSSMSGDKLASDITNFVDSNLSNLFSPSKEVDGPQIIRAEETQEALNYLKSRYTVHERTLHQEDNLENFHEKCHALHFPKPWSSSIGFLIKSPDGRYFATEGLLYLFPDTSWSWARLNDGPSGPLTYYVYK